MTTKKPKPRSKLHRAFTESLRNAWHTIARPEQLPPEGNWTTWVFCGGRGAGKTRSGSEWVQSRVEAGTARRIHLVAPTSADCRDVMLEGSSGLMNIASTHMRPVYQPSLRKVTWPNGCVALLFSSDEPDRLRGPQCDSLWIDELCAMRQAQEVLDMSMFGLRLGKDPRCLITTTPRPIKCFKALLARDGEDVRVSRGSTMDNAANLARPFLDQIISRYQDTRLGRQEIYAELLTDTPGALWHLERIEELRVNRAPSQLERVVVAIDPAVTFGPDADETGILVVGRAVDGQAYVLDDLSGRFPPIEWAQRAINAYREHRADRVVAEVNQGGSLVETTLRSVDPGIPFRAVHASRAKMVRAEPVSALYEQGKVHHVGVFGPLEDQMTAYDGQRFGASPDRLDALVWGLTELMLGEPLGGYFKPAALLVDGEPAQLPLRPEKIFVTLAMTDRPDSGVGVCYWSRSRHYGIPVVLLDWDVVEVDVALADGYLLAVYRRALELCELTQATWRQSNGGPRMPFGLWVEEAGLGPTFLRQGLQAGIDIRAIPEKLLPPGIDDRAQAVKGYVSGGRLIKLGAQAHERVLTHRGVSQNHLLKQVFGFETGVKEQPAELLNSFCVGIALALEDPARVTLPQEFTQLATPTLSAEVEEHTSPAELARQQADAELAAQVATARAQFLAVIQERVAQGLPLPATPAAAGIVVPVRHNTLKLG